MAIVVTDDKHYKAIADAIREEIPWGRDLKTKELKPSEMADAVDMLCAMVQDEGYVSGFDDGYSSGFQMGYDDGFTAGEQSGLATCTGQHFVQTFVGDGGTSHSFYVPFEPDFIQIFCYDPTVGYKRGAIAMFYYDRRAFGRVAGGIQYGYGDGATTSGSLSTTSALNRYSRADDGTVTINVLDYMMYSTGLPHTIVAVKYTEQTDKERITDFVNGLTGSGSVTLNQAKVNAAFTDEEWAELIGTKPDWTFAWI